MSEQANPNTCPICRDELEYYAYGSCNHPTCLACAVKLRRFGNSQDVNYGNCPTCRANLKKVIVMHKHEQFDQVDKNSLVPEPELDIYFENESIVKHYKSLMACICPQCGYVANNMSALNRHTTNLHGLSFCDLCLRFAHMLPSEFKPMTGEELAIHRRWDKVRKRGHPVCEFCQQTFYEFENLVTHIKDSHFLCDICHTSGVFEVFRRQNELFNHYKSVHHVCPECEAMGRMSCFSCEEQLGIHRRRDHPQECRNDPTLWEPLQVRYSTRGLLGANTRGRRGRNEPSGGEEDGVPAIYYPAEPRGPQPEEWTATDFPSLTGATTTAIETQNQSQTSTSNRPVRSLAAVVSGSSAMDGPDDFPSLPVAASSSTSAPQAKWVKGQSKPSAAGASSSSSRRYTPQAPPSRDDFPSLVGSSSASTNPSWGVTSSSPSTAATVIGKQRTPTKADFPSLGSSGSQQGGSIFKEPRLTPFVPPKAVPKNGKAKEAKVKQPPLPPAKDIQPFSSALDKAKKQAWWDEADNDGAIARLSIEDGDTVGPKPTYSRIQTVNRAETNGTVSKPTAPPDFSAQEFPTLGGASKKKAKNNSNSNIKNNNNAKKPAFKSKNPVAPAPKSDRENNQPAVKSLDDLIDTETYLFQDNVYTPPSDHAAKNQTVIEMAQKILNSGDHSKNAFSRFANLSRLYSRGQLAAADYLEALSSLLTNEADATDSDWLSMMVVLLPNVGLQRALLRAMRGDAAPRVPSVATPARSKGNTPPVWAKSVASTLQVCSTCGQVCQRSGMREHTQKVHS